MPLVLTPATVSEPDLLARRKVLIVDDEEGPRQSIRAVFKEHYNVLMADNGLRAIELARESNIDVAVLDIRMVGMSGIDLLVRLKAIDPDMQVVMLTAYETVETARQALRLGACDYLTKPFDITTLREAIKTAVSRRVLSEQIRTNNHKLRELQEEVQKQQIRHDLARSQTEIYASIIHDINGPLTLISGFTEVINSRIAARTKLDGEDLELVKAKLGGIIRQITNCVEVSQRYLSFLRAARLGQTKTEVNNLLAEFQEMIALSPDLKRNQLFVQPHATPLTADINRTDLLQILMNLVKNAFQSTSEPHKVIVHAGLQQHLVDAKAPAEWRPEAWINRDAVEHKTPLIKLVVEDDGTGIPPGNISKVFEPYFSTKQAEEGTGVGLAIVRRLIENAKGSIHLVSELGKGTVFTLYLPVG
jgi:signal transduction histidine kinase